MKTIEYKPEFGEIDFPDGFEQKLSGKSLEEQMDCYRITVENSYERSSYGDLDSSHKTGKIVTLDECDDVKELVVKDGIIVGVMLYVSTARRNIFCGPGKGLMTYFVFDSDGTGGSSGGVRCSLTCV